MLAPHGSRQSQPIQIVFLCGARDFHAFDWYQSALKANIHPKPIILTDLIAGEGFKQLVNGDDIVSKLLILDKWLPRKQSAAANIWRNALKAFVFPIQVLLIRRFASKHQPCIYYAHSMYYIWLAWAARIKFIGTPQGSDILVKPYKSRIFWLLSRWSIRSALFVTVDSSRMAHGVKLIANVTPMVLQNGIDIASLKETISLHAVNQDCASNRIISFRGFTPLYRIREVLLARNSSKKYSNTGIDFIYPFYEESYLRNVSSLRLGHDTLMGRIEREEMYSLFHNSLLCISIPSSDSSPRSVYEAIFCGAAVAVSDQGYIYDLPCSMRERIIVVNLDDPDWLDLAIDQAYSLRPKRFEPCEEALTTFDQLRSFQRLYRFSLDAANHA